MWVFKCWFGLMCSTRADHLFVGIMRVAGQLFGRSLLVYVCRIFVDRRARVFTINRIRTLKYKLQGAAGPRIRA